MPIKIDNKNVYSEADEDHMTVHYKGLQSRVHRLFSVCTARMVENLCGGHIREELEAWIEFLNQDYDANISDRGYYWSYHCYKPQMLIAVTTSHQIDANKALTLVGFQPSTPVNNAKYDGTLINWTYELNPLPAQEAAKELPSVD